MKPLSPTDIIFSYFEYCDATKDVTELLTSFSKYFGEDAMVRWFVEEIFASDEEDLRDALDPENADIIIHHYHSHC
jgi:hypothetical protein